MNICINVSLHFLGGLCHVYNGVRFHSFHLPNLPINPLPIKDVAVCWDKLPDLKVDWVLAKSVADLDGFHFGRLPINHVRHFHVIPSLRPSQAWRIPLAKQQCISNLIAKTGEPVHLLIYDGCASSAAPMGVVIISYALIC